MDESNKSGGTEVGGFFPTRNTSFVNIGANSDDDDDDSVRVINDTDGMLEVKPDSNQAL